MSTLLVRGSPNSTAVHCRDVDAFSQDLRGRHDGHLRPGSGVTEPAKGLPDRRGAHAAVHRFRADRHTTDLTEGGGGGGESAGGGDAVVEGQHPADLVAADSISQGAQRLITRVVLFVSDND
jgi:hypothetical protein